MARILVTGGAGYVGSVCCAQLIARGHHVEVVDDLDRVRLRSPSRAVLHRVPIADEEALSAILASRRFEAVFHFAAKVLRSRSQLQILDRFSTRMWRAGFRCSKYFGNTAFATLPFPRVQQSMGHHISHRSQKSTLRNQ